MAHSFQPSFDDLSIPLFDVTFCVLDLETTGGSPTDCEITELGAVKYRGGDLLGSFQTLVDPGLPIPPSITVLTGITQAMVMAAPPIESVLPAFLEFLGDAVIVGHNVRFDLGFLNAATSRLGYGKLSNESVDTAALARRVIRPEVRNLRLQTLASHFRSPVRPVHRALEDAQATAHVLHGLLERVGSLGVTNLDDLLQLPRAKGSPHYSKISLTEQLPRSPGVYIFRDRDGSPMYVGKATNLRARVRQYFYGDTRRSIGNMLRELHSIEARECETVVEAEVAELRLIHAHHPRYNRRSRAPKTSHFVKLTKEKYPRLSLVRTIKEDGLAYLGPFRSKRAADMVMTAIWDAIPIRRCRGRSGTRAATCAAAQLGVSYCPCDGRLATAEYDTIVQRLVSGMTTEPDVLLRPLTERMERMSRDLRYEEAAWVRDRHEALARALEQRHQWQALRRAGLLEVETADGRIVLIDHGVLVGSRAPGDDLHAGIGPGEGSTVPEVPPTVSAAEEALVLWRWLTQTPIRLVDSTGYLALPSRPVVRLKNPPAAAA